MSAEAVSKTRGTEGTVGVVGFEGVSGEVGEEGLEGRLELLEFFCHCAVSVTALAGMVKVVSVLEESAKVPPPSEVQPWKR